MSGSCERPGWIVVAVAGLGVMVVWTMVVKYMVPLHWYWAERLAGRPIEGPPVMWDLWPLAHAALAAGLWRRSRWAWRLGAAVATIEIAVVATKFVFFARAPELDVWRLLWLTNKIYVIAFFVWLLVALLVPRRREWFHPVEGE